MTRILETNGKNRGSFMRKVSVLAASSGCPELRFGFGKKPEVSIIVRTHESGKFIRDALDSIKAQDFKGMIEVVIDYPKGTKDNTIEQIHEFVNGLAKSGAENISVRILFDEGLNASEALRNGLRHAMGRYTAILDYDNIYVRDKLSVQTSFMKANEFHFSFTNCDMVDANLKRIRFMLHKPRRRYKGFNSLLNKFFVDANTIMFDGQFKRLMLRAYGVIDLPLYKNVFDDYLMGFIALFTGNLNLLEKPLVLYRVSGFNSSVLRGGEPDEVVFDRNLWLSMHVEDTLAALIKINEKLHLTDKKLALGNTLRLSSKPLRAKFDRFGRLYG